jgi:hypothetical protein
MQSIKEDIAQLEALGEACFGANWRNGLADGFGIAPRTVRRWLNGERIIPQETWRYMAGLAASRAARIAAVVARIEAGLPPLSKTPEI